MSVHTEQISAAIRRTVQEILARGLNDPRVRGLISVTGVRVSSDLRHATVSVSILPEQHAELSMHGLRSASGHLRREVGRRVRMRHVPMIAFELDHSIKREAALSAALARARAADEQRQGEARAGAEGSS
jgi:ribosome-binding factor A